MIINAYLKHINLHKMSLCFDQINIYAFGPRKKTYLKNIKKIYLKCNINKCHLNDIIEFSLSEYCNLTAFGYSNMSDEFWGKKINKNNYLLYFNLTVKSCSFESSEIIITPIFGSDEEIKNIIINIQKMIDLYERSFIIK